MDEEKIDWKDTIWKDTIKYIADCMSLKYPFLSKDDIESAANEGCWLAFLSFDPKRAKKGKLKHVKIKGYFNTIDVLRREKLFDRSTPTIYSKHKTYNESDEISLDKNFIQPKNYDNFDKMWFELTDGLSSFYRRLLYLRYIENRSLHEMAKIMKITEKYIVQFIYNARKRLCELNDVSDDGINMKSAMVSGMINGKRRN